jgi:hypothetical protein
MGNGLLQVEIIRLLRCKYYKRAFERRVADAINVELIARQFAI